MHPSLGGHLIHPYVDGWSLSGRSCVHPANESHADIQSRRSTLKTRKMAIYLGIDEGGCLDVKSMKGGRPLYVRELTSDLDPLGPCGRVTALHLSYFVKLQGNTRTHNSHSKVKQKKIIVMNIKYSCTSSQSSL